MLPSGNESPVPCPQCRQLCYRPERIYATLTCPVCQSDDGPPYLLTCRHAICAPCLHRIRIPDPPTPAWRAFQSADMTGGRRNSMTLSSPLVTARSSQTTSFRSQNRSRSPHFRNESSTVSEEEVNQLGRQIAATLKGGSLPLETLAQRLLRRTNGHNNESASAAMKTRILAVVQQSKRSDNSKRFSREYKEDGTFVIVKNCR